MPTGSFIIANEKARTDMLVRVLDTIEVNGRMDSAKASELQGLLNFEYIGYYAGELMKQRVLTFSSFATEPGFHSNEYAKFTIKHLPPRVHDINNHNPCL